MVHQPNLIVSCTSNNDILIKRASDLAYSLELSLTMLQDVPHNYQFVLHLTAKGLELLSKEPHQKKTSSLFVDFTKGQSGYRLQHNLTIHQPLAKAIGIKTGFRPSVIDATAGLGGDSFVLASLGCRVTMIERSPIIGALLSDGLKRAEKNVKCRAIIQKRLNLVIMDAAPYMTTIMEKPYAIYLDPMYPHRNKSALNKIDMRIIRNMVGDDMDSSILLSQALKTATNRVVVKRPKGAPTINSAKPNHIISMKNGRFDVYLILGSH